MNFFEGEKAGNDTCLESLRHSATRFQAFWHTCLILILAHPQGDLVDVSSDEELHAALEVLPAGSVLRIVVSARAAPGVQNAKPKYNDKDKDKAELKLLRALEKDAEKKEKEAKKEARQARKAAKESGINLQENICQVLPHLHLVLCGACPPATSVCSPHKQMLLCGSARLEISDVR